ncbi:MAG: hypothetical protein ACI8PP_001711 [Candidatus Pseudothioglobus sp.]|jgi:hypothetical protein
MTGAGNISFSKKQPNRVLIVAATKNGTNEFLFENAIQLGMKDIDDNGFVGMAVIEDAFPTKDAIENHIFKHP